MRAARAERMGDKPAESGSVVIVQRTWFNEPGTVPPSQEWVPSAFNYTRATTIYGGSNEIQKNIIAKLILGLPSR